MKKFIVLPLLLLALLGISATANAGFEFEPNDGSTTATPLKLNEVFTGNFDNSYGASDYYKLTLTKPSEITLHFKNTMQNSPSVSFGVWNSTVTAALLSQSIAASDTSDNILRINLAAGIFYIRIYQLDSSNKTYELSAQSPLGVSRPITIPSVVGSVSLPDLNGNGYKDVAILRILADASTVVDTIDSFTGIQLNRVSYVTDSRVAQPISIIGFDDVDGNGTPDIGVLVYQKSKNQHTQYIRNAVTGALVKSFVVK
jgi:hypothetical protein